jgi:hypothetical protein
MSKRRISRRGADSSTQSGGKQPACRFLKSLPFGAKEFG